MAAETIFGIPARCEGDPARAAVVLPACPLLRDVTAETDRFVAGLRP
ncbi:hypothetical protein ACIBQ1_58100 [Nonomuraea sp. NPDC050153]